MNSTLRCLGRPKAVMALLMAGATLVAGLSAALEVAVHAGGQRAAHLVAAAGPPPDPDPDPPHVAAAGPPPVIVEEDALIADVAHFEVAAANPPPDPKPVDS